jgi:glutamine amidotransferase
VEQVVIVDYGVGNLYSVARALSAVGADATVSSDAHAIQNADRLVVPGVGAFGDGIAALRDRGLEDSIREFSASGRPVLGICLGAQLFLDEGREFGVHRGLGLLRGAVVPFVDQIGPERDKIPHVGWNALAPGPSGAGWPKGILSGIHPGDSVYFTHSYVIDAGDPADVVAVSDYASQKVTAVFEHDNIHGCQFHPEKSGPIGLAILKRFLAV